MKLYHIPGSCSLGIQALLEEVGEPYELVPVGAPDSEERSRYRQFNPKGKVPALQFDDGSLLTEFPAIALYLARRYEDRNLLSGSCEQQARIFEVIEYIVSTGHMQGFARIRRPDRFSDDEQDYPKIRGAGLIIFQECLDRCDAILENREFACGDLSIADFALFYMEHWSAAGGVGSLGPNCRRHYETMKNRASVMKVLG